jgi:hypothetical protein
VHVPELLHSLLRAPGIEIIEAVLPESALGFIAEEESLARVSAFSLGQERVRRPLLQHRHDRGRSAHLRFCDQKMNMLGHHDVSDDYESVLLPRLFENGKEAVARTGCVEEWQAVIARASDKVQVMRTISTMQAGRHDKLMVSAASYPPLQKTQERGTRSFETGRRELKGMGHPPVDTPNP